MMLVKRYHWLSILSFIDWFLVLSLQLHIFIDVFLNFKKLRVTDEIKMINFNKRLNFKFGKIIMSVIMNRSKSKLVKGINGRRLLYNVKEQKKFFKHNWLKAWNVIIKTCISFSFELHKVIGMSIYIFFVKIHMSFYWYILSFLNSMMPL